MQELDRVPAVDVQVDKERILPGGKEIAGDIVNPLKDMVGTTGLEPATSTVSKLIYSVPLTTYITAGDYPKPWKYA